MVQAVVSLMCMTIYKPLITTINTTVFQVAILAKHQIITLLINVQK